jgi:hypothetical protein
MKETLKFGKAICEHCNKEYTKQRQKQRFCKTLCRNRAWWVRKNTAGSEPPAV